MSYRCTAWRSRQNWLKVCHDLFSSDPADIRNGLVSVQCWQARYKVPVGVEVTCELLQAKLAALQQPINPDILRNITSMALIRFVNGISDLYQQKRSLPKSIRLTLLEIGIPEWVCDQRHDATHHTMPCMSVLEKAVDFCLEWIHSFYWEDTRSYSEGYQTRFINQLKEINALNSITPPSSNNTLLALARKIGSRDLVGMCLLEANSSELNFDSHSPSVASLPHLDADHNKLNQFWFRLLTCLDNSSTWSLSVSLISTIVKRLSKLELDEMSLLYHGVWLRLAIKQLSLSSRSKKVLSHKNRTFKRKVKNVKFNFAPCILQTILSHPNVFTHAAFRTLLKCFPHLCKQKKANRILKLTKWISMVRRRDFHTVSELSGELSTIVAVQKDIFSKIRSRNKREHTWRAVDPRKYSQVHIGECIQ